MIAIIDYGLGNLRAFANIYKKLNIPAEIVKKPAQLEQATKIILPGVGAFDHAMSQLNGSGLREKLDDLVLNRAIPILGVCVGMQILGNASDEGHLQGLGWIEGDIKKLNVTHIKQKPQLPHMGWNDVQPIKNTPLFEGLTNDAIFYFLHSYYFFCKKNEDVLAKSTYGFEYTCAINHKNIYGVQFHPEKSHHYGIQLLKNFATI